MVIKIITSILYLRIEPNTPLIIDGITFAPYDEKSVRYFLGERFYLDLGLYGWSKIKTNSILACTSIEDALIIKSPKDTDSIDLASDITKNDIEIFKHLVVTLDTFLWFIKDNSCIISDILCYSYAGVVNGLIPTSYRPIVSNCRGEFEEVIYSKNEVDEAIKIRNRFFELCPLYKDVDEEYLPVNDAVTGNSKKNNKAKKDKEIVRDLTSLERAFSFLRDARHSKNLSPKVASYMALFESLFSTDDKEVTHKVCERTAFYLGENEESRKKIYANMYESYNIRSKHVHGSSSKDTLRDKKYRINLLEHLDRYARAILKDIILYNSHNFKNEEAQAKYLKSLVFSDKYPSINIDGNDGENI